MFALPLSNVSNDFLYKIKDFFLRGEDQTKVSSKVSLTRVDMDNRQISRCVVFCLYECVLFLLVKSLKRINLQAG